MSLIIGPFNIIYHISNSEKPKRDSLRRPKKISESEKTKIPLHGSSSSPVEKKAGEKLIQVEKAETGKVSFQVYLYYIRSIGVAATLLTVISYVLSQVCSVGSNVWLAALSEENFENDTMDTDVRDKYLGVYTALGVGQGESSFSLSMGKFQCL